MQANRSEEHGVEQIATVTIPAGTPAGTIVLQMPIAAPEIGVRLSTFSRLWTKTKFRRFVVEAVSSNPTSVGGNYTLAIDPDPVQTYTSDERLPARLMALTMATKTNAWADACLNMLPNLLSLFNRFDPATASDAEIREYAAGQVVMATTTDYEDDCEYTVNVGWDVEFEKPDTTPDLEDLVGPPVPTQTRAVFGGRAYTAITPTIIAIADGASCFTPPPTANLDYIVRDNLTLILEHETSVGPIEYTARVLNFSYILATNAISLTVSNSSGLDLVPGIVGLQVPSIYYLDQGGTMVQKIFQRPGIGLIHPIFLKKNKTEVEWMKNARRRRVQKEFQKRLVNEVARKRAEIVAEQPLEELERQLESLLV